MTQLNREYVVTLKNKDELGKFYEDMETEGTFDYVPSRAVECANKREISRNTHYLISNEEAAVLQNDPRVEAVTLVAKLQGVKSILHADQTATWSKAGSIAVDQKNWGLYRTGLESNIEGWGSETGTGNQSATVKFTATGANVDVVVLDEIAYADHLEFSGRMQEYDWFANHNLTAWPLNPNANYVYNSYSGDNNHATHVAGIIGGDTQGWARGATLFNLRHDSSGVNGDAGVYTPSDRIIDYIRAFHASKSVNPATGYVNPTLVNCSWGLGIDCDLLNPMIDPDRYPSGRGPRISKIGYRGDVITAATLGNTVVDTGYSGICNSGTRLAQLSSYANGGTRIETTSNTAVTVASQTIAMLGRASLTDAGVPTNSDANGVDLYDDAVWRINPPWNISYCGATCGPTGDFAYIQVSTNSYVTFGGGLTEARAYFVGATAPAARKILISAGDRSCQKMLYGIEGTGSNRTWRVRWEGHESPNNGVPGSPTLLWEMTFYEATPNRIDLRIADNECYRAEFTIPQLESYGILQNGALAPYRDPALDADVVDAISEGIIFVGSAGNGGFKVNRTSDVDYNNYFVDNGEDFYYHRGASPATSHPDIICVGAYNSFATEGKLNISNTGPRVDIYAPGSNIASAVYNATGSTNGNTGGVVNTGEAALTITNIVRASNLATITTSGAHDLITGDVVTIACSDSSFNASMATITSLSYNTFRYSNAGGDVSSTAASGTATPGYYYQKYNGSSMAAAQVTGLLALALQTYPNLTQSEAKAYITTKGAKLSKLQVTTGGYTDTASLQGGTNRVAFYYKERKSEGSILPKFDYKLRPASGSVYPRPKIKRG